MMRPGLQPFIAWVLGRGLLAVGLYSPFTLVALLQLMSAAFSIVALCALFRAVYDELGTAWRRRWFLYVGFFLCVEAYLHVHFTAEMAAGNLLVLLAARTLRLRHETPTAEFRTGILLGLLAGLTFAVRYQADSPWPDTVSGCSATTVAGASSRGWCRACCWHWPPAC